MDLNRMQTLNIMKDAKTYIVFDLGGTYFRSGLYSFKDGLKEVIQQQAYSFSSLPDASVAELKQKMVDYLVRTARAYAKKTEVNQASIALGAALDGHRGIVYSSGPLWGSDISLFDLQAALSQEAPEIDWHIVNDVTASVWHYANQCESKNIRKILLLTISTGIACRLIDLRNKHIALDKFGLQGEIGHLPVTVSYKGQIYESQCDCGGENHLAAFASGRGLAQLCELLSQYEPLLWSNSLLAKLLSQGVIYTSALPQALSQNDEFAQVLISLATKNIAEVLRTILAIDPEIDQIVLVGGVATNLGEYYKSMLAEHLHEQGLYLSSHFDSDFLKQRIVIANKDQVNNLIGAALYASEKDKKNYA